MKRLAALNRLSWQDAGYLRRERDTQPLHFVLLALVEPAASGAAVGLQQVREHVAARLHRVPHLRRKVRGAPLGIGPLVWVDDDSFRLDRHVRTWGIAVTDAADLSAPLADLAAQRLDTTLPLWELAVAPPLLDGRTPLAFRVHHALMDGGLVAAVLQDLFTAEHAGAVPAWRPAAGPSAARLLTVGVRDRLRDRVRMWSRSHPGGSTAPAEAPMLRPTRARLAGPVSGERAVAFLTVPLGDLQRVRQTTGATINDVFLAAVADGLHEYLAARGEMDGDDPLLALVPRDVRAPEEARAAGNRTWSMYVALPVGAQHPENRLTAVRAATTVAKAAKRSAGAAGFRFDIAVSNVRFGSGHHVAGAAIGGYYAAAPLQGENRLLAVGLSYDDAFSVSFTGDGAVYQDLDALAAHTAAAVGRLVSACAEQPS